MEPEIVAFMSSCTLYTGDNYIHYSLMGKMRLLCKCSDLLFRGAFKADLTVYVIDVLFMAYYIL